MTRKPNAKPIAPAPSSPSPPTLAIAVAQGATQRALVATSTMLDSPDDHNDNKEPGDALPVGVPMRTIAMDLAGMGPLARTIWQQTALCRRIRLIQR